MDWFVKFHVLIFCDAQHLKYINNGTLLCNQLVVILNSHPKKHHFQFLKKAFTVRVHSHSFIHFTPTHLHNFADLSFSPSGSPQFSPRFLFFSIHWWWHRWVLYRFLWKPMPTPLWWWWCFRTGITSFLHQSLTLWMLHR